MLRWQFAGQRIGWPAHRDNRVHAPPPAAASLAEDAIAVTFIGQATFLLTTRAGTVLTDPVFSDRISPFSFAGPRRVRPPGLALDALPAIDLILLSHNHYDHMDLASLRRLALRATGPVPIVTGLGNAAYLAAHGVPGAIERDWWDSTALRPDLRVTFVPAQHWSSRSLSDRRRTLWGGFVLQASDRTIYFAGDSGYCGWFAAIAARYGAPDLALLPIGAYAPRWFMQAQHMDPAEAVQAHRDLGAAQSVGMHFGTVQLTDEAIDEPVQHLAAACTAAGVAADAFTTLDFGETRLFRFAVR